MTPVVHFLSGLPRSGSTLLANVLAQNPLLAPTPSSGLCNLIGMVQTNWQQVEFLRSQGEAAVPVVSSTLRGMMYGFHEKELGAGRVVIDKNRAWVSQIEVLEAVLRRPVRVIVTIRDVRAIVASFEKAYRRSPIERRPIGATPQSPLGAMTVYERTEALLSRAGAVGFAAAALRDALDRDLGDDRLIIIPYEALTRHPKQVFAELHMRLGLPPFHYDFEHVAQATHEDDSVYGFGYRFHDVRPKVEPVVDDWEKVLPAPILQSLEQNFGWLNQMAKLSNLELPKIEVEPQGEQQSAAGEA